MKKEVGYESDSDDFGRETQTNDLDRVEEEDSDDFGRDEATMKKNQEIVVENEDSDDDFGRDTVQEQTVSKKMGDGLASQLENAEDSDTFVDDDCKTFNFKGDDT